MDLIATVSTGTNKRDVVEVWRKNGQRVFAVLPSETTPIDPEDELENGKVSSLVWRSDGKMLAVKWSSGLVAIVDTYNGKVAHLLRSRPVRGQGVPDWSSAGGGGADGVITVGSAAVMTWQSHFINPSEVRQLIGRDHNKLVSSGDEDHGKRTGLFSLEDILVQNANDIAQLIDSGSNLPRELSRLEIDIALPKLSTLPAVATGADDDIFSTRHSIDTLFHAATATNGENGPSSGAHGPDMVDVLLTNTDRCAVHISIYDSFVIGNIDTAAALPKGLRGMKLLQATSHPLSTMYCLVLQAIKDGPAKATPTEHESSLHLVGLDLRFISQTSYNLPLLATKATQLQNLLRYMTQISSLLSAEVRTAFDLPTRFVENINESLAEDDQNANFMTQAYHLIATGMCNEKFRDWLVDQVGDRGLKRWEKAVGDCLDTIRRMTSECLLPAIERAQIVLSRLDGLSRFADTASRLGLDERSIRDTREVLDTLNILCEDMLADVCLEIREFAAFMRWLKWETEVQTMGEDSERAEEMRESYHGEAEIRTVLDYIESAMKTSRLMGYVRPDPGSATPTAPAFEGLNALDTYKKARKSPKADTLPRLSDLLQSMASRSQVVFDSIAETLRKNVLVSYVTAMPTYCNADVMCSSIYPHGSDGLFEIHVVSLKDGSQDRTLFDLICSADTNSRNTISLKSTRTYEAPDGCVVTDIGLVGPSNIAALVEDKASGDISIVAYSLSGSGAEGPLRHVFPSGTMGVGMSPGRLSRGLDKTGSKIVVTDGHKLGFVVLEE